MKHPEEFSQMLQAVFDRASALRVQAGKKPLSLRKTAEETGIEVSVLSRMCRGISQPDPDNLVQLLGFLGCSNQEQQVIFHLASLATPEETRHAVEQVTRIFSSDRVAYQQEAQKPHVLDRIELEVLSLQAPSDSPMYSQGSTDTQSKSNPVNPKTYRKDM